mmetsp:Transcript_2191/g.2122  ORF Transcript_2191/g.2122 Transcript_2191/m.2122 type:complete len:95 (+) Transcript_2191:604-888(+)
MPPRNADFTTLDFNEIAVPDYGGVYIPPWYPVVCNHQDYSGEVFGYCMFDGGSTRTDCVTRVEAEDLCQERNCFELTTNKDCLCERDTFIDLGT